MDDVRPLLDLTKDALADVTVVAYQSWETSRHRVAAVEPGTGLVTLTGPANWPFLQWALRSATTWRTSPPPSTRRGSGTSTATGH